MQCLKIISENPEYKSYLIISDSAKVTINQETNYSLEEIYKYAGEVLEQNNIGAGPASGTFKTEGMIIVPYSMKSIAGINSGYTDNLILRAADVTIKEQRKLVLEARETPLSTIHLRNLYELSKIPRVRIIPPIMMFCNFPGGIEDMIYHIAAKLLEPFGIEAKEYINYEKKLSFSKLSMKILKVGDDYNITILGGAS